MQRHPPVLGTQSEGYAGTQYLNHSVLHRPQLIAVMQQSHRVAARGEPHRRSAWGGVVGTQIDCARKGDDHCNRSRLLSHRSRAKSDCYHPKHEMLHDFLPRNRGLCCNDSRTIWKPASTGLWNSSTNATKTKSVQ